MRKKQGLDSSIGVRIKTAREKAGYTQDRLAELTDVGVPYLAKLETGRVGISLPNFINFCQVLGISADYLIWGERAENNASDIAERIRYIPEKQYALLEKIINSYLEAMQWTEANINKENKD
jgi:transcriptional regulator with XRE-family HTH domain